DERAALPPPGVGRGREGARLRAQQFALPQGRDLDHAVFAVGEQRGEDAAVGAEVGGVHVLAFDRAGQRQREAAEVVGRHRRGPCAPAARALALPLAGCREGAALPAPTLPRLPPPNTTSNTSSNLSA